MKSEEECEVAAKAALEAYVNGCGCKNTQDVLRAIEKMVAMAMFAHDVVTHGQKDAVQ